MNPPIMNQAIEDYHYLLDNDKLAAASIEQLHASQHAANLYFGDHPLSVSLRPRLISSEDWARTVDAAVSVQGALEVLEAALLADAGLRSELDLDPAEEQLCLAHTGSESSSPSARLDSFSADEVRYVEYNAESPAGMAYGDALTSVMDSLR